MEHEQIDYLTAARNLHEIDHVRRAYVSHFYPRSGHWEDPRHYHMVLDSTAISTDACVEIITQGATDFFARSKAATGAKA